MDKSAVSKKTRKTLLWAFLAFLPFAAAGFLVYTVFSPEFGTEIPRKYFYFIFLVSIIFSKALLFRFSKGRGFASLLGTALLVFLPAQVVLSLALYRDALSFHPFIYLFSSAYLISFFVFAVLKHRNVRGRENLPVAEKKPLFEKNGLIGLFFSFIVAGIFLIFGLSDLGKFAAVDEPLWTFDRIPKYWNNVADGEFKKTMISDKPGVTVAILSGPALNFLDPKEYRTEREDGYLVNPKNDFERFNFLFRFPILLFSALMIPFFYLLTLKLSDMRTALFASIFIGLSPILLGISTIVNPDSLLWIFLPLSMLGYFAYLKENRNILYLFMAGILMGFGLLTKYITNILAIYFLLIIFAELAFAEKSSRAEFNRNFRSLLADYLMLILTALITAFLFLPAAWINPARLLQITIWSEAFQKIWPFFAIGLAAIFSEAFVFKSRLSYPFFDLVSRKKIWLIRKTGFFFLLFSVFSIANTYLGMKWYDFESIIASPKTSSLLNSFFGFFIANFYSLVFGIAPLILLLIFYAAGKNIFAKDQNSAQKWTAYLFIFIFIYYFASAMSLVSATVRYQIVIFPIAFTIAAFGASSLLDGLKLKNSRMAYGAALVFFIAGIFSLNSIKPHYFSYASDLLPKNYVLNYKDMGDGSYEAAEFINSREGAEDLRVWTDKRGVCYFIKGKCATDIEFKEDLQFDYFVISAGRKNRIQRLSSTRGSRSVYPMDLKKLYEAEKLVFTLEIGGRPNNFVRVISSQDISLK
ncbi:MAG TPA: hypothetical protein DIT25_03420 [Candidatus Moranbacteria bacterium]|nr:hypothetical protein [Candidatus Moranbacteria bacterium]